MRVIVTKVVEFKSPKTSVEWVILHTLCVEDNSVNDVWLTRSDFIKLGLEGRNIVTDLLVADLYDHSPRVRLEYNADGKLVGAQVGDVIK